MVRCAASWVKLYVKNLSSLKLGEMMGLDEAAEVEIVSVDGTTDGDEKNLREILSKYISVLDAHEQKEKAASPGAAFSFCLDLSANYHQSALRRMKVGTSKSSSRIDGGKAGGRTG